MSELSQKLLARSKYFHSKNKDKNRYKKKAKHVQPKPNESTNNEPDAEELPEEDEESDVDQSRFRRRNIETNAHRYEKPEEIYEEEDLSEMISLQESTHASQFRFLSEQEWEEEQSQGKSGSEISINYETLGATLNSLPLFVKLKIEEELLTEDLKNNKLTTKEEPNLNEFIISHVTPTLEDKHSTFPSQTNVIVSDKTLEDDQQVLESLLNLAKQESTSPSPKGQEDLEQWLESVI